MPIRTLTTRIGGYKFVIETNGSQAIGEFVAENGDGMSLPFELRSCWTNNNGQTTGIFAAGVSAVETLIERCSAFSGICECYRAAETCERCKIDSALLARTMLHLRGHYWETKYQKIKFSR